MLNFRLRVVLLRVGCLCKACCGGGAINDHRENCCHRRLESHRYNLRHCCNRHRHSCCRAMTSCYSCCYCATKRMNCFAMTSCCSYCCVTKRMNCCATMSCYCKSSCADSASCPNRDRLLSASLTMMTSPTERPDGCVTMSQSRLPLYCATNLTSRLRDLR